MEPVKQVLSRGTNLQQAFNSPATAAPTKGPAVQVDLGPVDWLQYGGKLLTQLPLHFGCCRGGGGTTLLGINLTRSLVIYRTAQ